MRFTRGRTLRQLARLTCYYDSEARRLIAINEETDDVRVLEPLSFEDGDEEE
jgi:hypothetical protein